MTNTCHTETRTPYSHPTDRWLINLSMDIHIKCGNMTPRSLFISHLISLYYFFIVKRYFTSALKPIVLVLRFISLWHHLNRVIAFDLSFLVTLAADATIYYPCNIVYKICYMRKCGIRAASIHLSLDILLYSISISMHKHKYGSLCSNSLYLGSSSRALDSMSNAIKATADRSISPFNINHRFNFCNCPSVMCSGFNPMKLLLAHLKNALLDHFSNRFCRRLTHEKWMLLENEIDC